ncbi:MAG: CRISPR-associated protein Cas4 [Caldilineae bacterium]|nr:MAG: CRISPR-associated protein Cas4 [Caldilineae bacterium]
MTTSKTSTRIFGGTVVENSVLASILIVIGFLILGVVLLRLGRARRARTGLPAGEVVYSDTGQWTEPERPLISRRYGLVGRPDYLVEVREGRKTVIAPVEVKSRRRPETPYVSHILQLAAYCLLVEDVYGSRPPYGLLHYADATLRIDFTDELRSQVLAAAQAIRAARQAPDVPRNHDDPGRCAACGYRAACGDEALS